jgi:hypothetical protein
MTSSLVKVHDVIKKENEAVSHVFGASPPNDSGKVSQGKKVDRK